MDNGLIIAIWLVCGLLGTLIAVFKKTIRWEPCHLDLALKATLFGPIWLLVCICTWLEIEVGCENSYRKVTKKRVSNKIINRFQLMDVDEILDN